MPLPMATQSPSPCAQPWFAHRHREDDPTTMSFDAVISLLTLHPIWLGLAIFLIACLECLAVAGVLIPGVVLLFAVSSLAGAGALSLPSALGLAYAGALLGDALSFALGRYFHQDIRRLKPFRQHPEWISHAERFFARYGMLSLLIGRFIGPLRPMLPMIAGMLDMPRMHFIFVSLLAAAGWAVAYITPGWLAGAAMQLDIPQAVWWQAGASTLLLCSPLAIGIGLGARNYRHSAAVTALASALCLIVLLVSRKHFAELDSFVLQALPARQSAMLERGAGFVVAMLDVPALLAGLAALCLALCAGRAPLPALFVVCAGLISTGIQALLGLTLAPPVLSATHVALTLALMVPLTLGVLLGRRLPARARLAWLATLSLVAMPLLLAPLYAGDWQTVSAPLSEVLAVALIACTGVASSQALLQWRTPLPALKGSTLCIGLVSFVLGIAAGVTTR